MPTDDGTDGQRTDDDDGRTWTDGQRTDDDDGTDDGTDGRTDGQRTTTTTTEHDGTRRDGRRTYPIFTRKYIDGLPLEIDSHRHFWTSNKISEPHRISYKSIFFIYTIFVIYTYATRRLASNI